MIYAGIGFVLVAAVIVGVLDLRPDTSPLGVGICTGLAIESAIAGLALIGYGTHQRVGVVITDLIKALL